MLDSLAEDTLCDFCCSHTSRSFLTYSFLSWTNPGDETLGDWKAHRHTEHCRHFTREAPDLQFLSGLEKPPYAWTQTGG